MILTVLMPADLGCDLYARRSPGPLRREGRVLTPDEFRRWLNAQLGPVLVAVLAHRDSHEFVVDVPDHTTIVHIPTAWFRHVPRCDLARRARLAARIAHATYTAPITIIPNFHEDPPWDPRDDADIPF